MPGRCEHHFNMRFDARTNEELDKLTDLFRCSRAELIRRLIITAAKHSIKREPHCANGSGCFVPQMHSKPTP